jgi:hypothetical protein
MVEAQHFVRTPTCFDYSTPRKNSIRTKENGNQKQGTHQSAQGTHFQITTTNQTPAKEAFIAPPLRASFYVH